MQVGHGPSNRLGGPSSRYWGAALQKAEQTVTAIKDAYIKRALGAWKGYERELLVEMVRGLDEAAFAFTMAPNRTQLSRDDVYRHNMLDGAASAIRPLLQRLADDAGGVPWQPTSPDRAALADEYLANCGRIAGVLRVAQLERFGLAEATFLADDRLVIEVVSEADERAERNAGHRLIGAAREALRRDERRLASQKAAIAAKIDRYVYPDEGWFVGYDNSDELVAYHRQAARIYGAGIAEASALPAGSKLGDRTFADWTEASIYSYGAVLQHCGFATRLMATCPGLELRNLLTVFARKDDIAAVWGERGEDDVSAAKVISAMSLDADAAERYDRDHDHPLPYYIDFGRDFVLLPMFGGLLNPFAGALSRVRAEYRRDWDRAVDGREAVFREDLRSLLPGARYQIPAKGVVLNREDGSRITDVDTVILDRSTGELILVQLKWPDIYGRSLSERNSRRLNLLAANDWVERVTEWIAGRNADQIAQQIGLGRAGPRPPTLLVLSRHTARFAGESGFDQRARWMSWPSLVAAYNTSPRAGIVTAMRRPKKTSTAQPRSSSSIHELPGLRVEIRAG